MSKNTVPRGFLSDRYCLDIKSNRGTLQYYFDMFYRNGTPTEESLWVSKTALRYNTVHYLSDGILEFGYGEINENGELVVTGIRYSPDYTLEDCRGRKIVYQINPMDLP